MIVGQQSDELTVSINSELTKSVVLEPQVSGVVFYPPFLLFTPNVTSQTFTFMGTAATTSLGNNINPVVTGGDYNNPSVNQVVWKVREAGDRSSYQLAQNILKGTHAVNVVPGKNLFSKFDPPIFFCQKLIVLCSYIPHHIL